ncbi:hypothetical protein [Anaerotruncus colihominis]|nr:hypothetical protein [Anaerotruncus colihominis]
MRMIKKVPLLLTALTVVLCLIACGSAQGGIIGSRKLPGSR